MKNAAVLHFFLDIIYQHRASPNATIWRLFRACYKPYLHKKYSFPHRA